MWTSTLTACSDHVGSVRHQPRSAASWASSSVNANRATFMPGDKVQTIFNSGSRDRDEQTSCRRRSKSTRERADDKSVAVETSSDHTLVLVPVSNRQKASGIDMGTGCSRRP
jgi:hypothetical protein